MCNHVSYDVIENKNKPKDKNILQLYLIWVYVHLYLLKNVLIIDLSKQMLNEKSGVRGS